MAEGFIAPRQLTNSAGRIKRFGKPGISIYKGADGLRLLFSVTSNSYKDRENEYITTNALARYVDKSWVTSDVCRPNNTLLFWHTGDPIGDIAWADMEGPFLLEVAKERPDAQINLADDDEPPILCSIKVVWDYLEANPDHIAWGASHGFGYDKKWIDPSDHSATYEHIEKFETSVLPLRNAANELTFTGVINMDERNDFLDKMLGKLGAAAGLRKNVQSVKQELDKQGVEHKAAKAEADKGLLDNVAAKVDAFVGQLTDTPPEGLKEAIMQLIASRMGEAPAEEAPAEDPMMGEGEMGMDGMMDDDERARMMPKMLKLMDTLTESQLDLVNAVKAIEARQAQQDAAFKTLTPLNTLAAAFKSMENRLGLIEKQLMGRPRGAASAAKDTATTITPEQAQQVKEQLTERDPFWGK